MITSFDKFIVAAVGAILFAANNWLGIDFAISDGTFDSIISIVTALAVYLVPNKA